jgi:hypothetical protein
MRFVLLLVAVLFVAGCPKRATVEGTYTNANSSIVLDLKSGGQASFAVMGETKQCTYTADGSQISLDCQGDKVVFTKQADDSLAPPAGSLIEPLKKKQ